MEKRNVRIRNRRRLLAILILAILTGTADLLSTVYRIPFGAGFVLATVIGVLVLAVIGGAKGKEVRTDEV